MAGYHKAGIEKKQSGCFLPSLVSCSSSQVIWRPSAYAALQVCQFNNASCGTFQALSQRGYMNVNTQNSGTLTADYQLTVRLLTQPELNRC